MRIRSLSKITAIVCAVLVAASIGGVFATWVFADGAPTAVESPVDFILGEFKWEGSEILPDDIEGEDHAWLINNLINGVKNGVEIGLDNPDSELNQYINNRLKGGWGWKRDYFGSMAVTGDAEMEALFGAAAEGLSFIIQVESDTEYYIYTTSVYLGERGEANWIGTSNKTKGDPSVPIGEYIYPIFRTKLVRASTSSPWDIVETKAGKAKSDWYDENRSNANITQIPAFDITTWVETEMGAEATTASAIWTFVGDDPTAYPATTTTPVYYRITPESSGTRRVASYAEGCVISIYDSAGGLVATSQTATDGEGAQYVFAEWSASAGTLYYISVSGALSIPITVR